MLFYVWTAKHVEHEMTSSGDSLALALRNAELQGNQGTGLRHRVLSGSRFLLVARIGDQEVIPIVRELSPGKSALTPQDIP